MVGCLVDKKRPEGATRRLLSGRVFQENLMAENYTAPGD